MERRKREISTLKYSSVPNFIKYDSNIGNGALNITPYQYIGYIQLYSILSCEHIKSTHLDSHVRS